MSEMPLHHRVLRRAGYLLTALLVAGAVAVLVWPLVGEKDAPEDGGAGRPQAQGPTPEGKGPNPFAMLDPNLNTNGSKSTGVCGVKSAYYVKAGDGIKVRVVYTGVGTVRATVLTEGGEPQIQAYTTAQDPTPHEFAFDDVVKQGLKKVGLTVMNSTGMTQCDVPAK
ncbi:hypothetical protein [Actinocorallia lasiicapitis]